MQLCVVISIALHVLGERTQTQCPLWQHTLETCGGCRGQQGARAPSAACSQFARRHKVSPTRTRLCTLQVQQVLDQWPRQLDAIRPDGPAATLVSSVAGAADTLRTPAALALVDRWQVPAVARTAALAHPCCDGYMARCAQSSAQRCKPAH
jgi:hypothetical protein